MANASGSDNAVSPGKSLGAGLLNLSALFNLPVSRILVIQVYTADIGFPSIKGRIAIIYF